MRSSYQVLFIIIQNYITIPSKYFTYTGMFRQNLTLHFNPAPTDAPCLQLDVSRTSKGLHLNLAGTASAVDFIDIQIPLERQRFATNIIRQNLALNITISLLLAGITVQ